MADNLNTRTQTWETIKKLTLELDSRGDADIIQHLESQGSIEEYVKRVIREDIARSSRQGTVQVPGINPDFVTKAEKDFESILNLLKKVVSK